MIAKFI